MRKDPPDAPTRTWAAGGALSRLLCAAAILLWAAAADAATFVVNSAADVADANKGDGVCETAMGNGVCTLRAAIQESNSLSGADTIELQAGVTYLLSPAFGRLIILDSVSIVGAGAASTTIDGNGSVINDYVLQVVQCIQNQTDGMGGCTIGPVVAGIRGVNIQHGAQGGIVASNASLTIADSSIVDNASDGGIDFNSNGSFDLERSTVSGNSSNFGGGGVTAGGTATINGCIIADNSTNAEGGGISAAGRLTIRDSVIDGNSADYGGGINSDYYLNVVNSTISGNFAHSDGGGLYYGGNATAGLYNTTVAGNQANDDASGTGVGGGVVLATGAGNTEILTFENTIIATNTNVTSADPYPIVNDDDCAGTIASLGNNIMYYVDTSHCTVTGAVVTADPKLGPLQGNGGPTATRALLAGSPAIDAGDPQGCTDELGATLTTDQRGLPRPVGAACDIGAFEVQPDLIFRDGFDPQP